MLHGEILGIYPTVDLIFEGEDIGTGLVEAHIWAMT